MLVLWGICPLPHSRAQQTVPPSWPSFTTAVIVRNKTFPNGGRLRVNMGNIYFEQKKYSTAIKMYRMALDQIPATSKEVSGLADMCPGGEALEPW
jgi:hypothetical protein